MKRNYKKAVRTVVILAVLLALFSVIAVPLSLSRRIQDFNNLKETVQEQTVQQDEHADEFHGLSHEEVWKSQITLLSAMNYAILGGTAVLWLVLGAYYWLLVMAWLYRSAVNEGMNKSFWPILGLLTNLLAVFAFLIVRDNPRREKSAAVQ